MIPLLEARIRAVYPTGKDWEPDESRIEANDNFDRLDQVFTLISSCLPVRIAYDWKGD
jgi:hypothetical protein